MSERMKLDGSLYLQQESPGQGLFLGHWGTGAGNGAELLLSVPQELCNLWPEREGRNDTADP